jgi:hypothetical protein
MTELATRDLAWARKITERLRLQATNYQETREKVIATLHEAREGGAAELLGFASWTAYLADVLGETPLRLERDARQELVAELSAEGMSTRSIAPIVGVTQKTIVKDLQVIPQVSPERDPVATWDAEGEYGGGTVYETAEAFVTSLSPEPPRRITGMDGKTYTAPEPRKPNRRALTDVARDTGWDIRKAVERLERVREDDRYSRNKNEVAELIRGHLIYVIETCQGILDDLNQNEEN